MMKEERKQSCFRLAALEASFRLVYDILGYLRYDRHLGVCLRIQASVRMLAAALCRCEYMPDRASAEAALSCVSQIRAEMERLCDTGILSPAHIARAAEAVEEIARYTELTVRSPSETEG